MLHDGAPMRLFAVRTLELQPHQWTARDVCDNYWRFYFNSRDGAWLKLPASTFSRFDLRGGRCYFVPPDVHFSCALDAPLCHFYVHFDVPGWPHFLARNPFDRPLEVPAENDLLRRVRALSENAADLSHQKVALLCRVKSLLWDALAACYEELPLPVRAQAVVESDSRVWAALQAIEAALSSHPRGANWSNAHLARLCHLSEDHFIRRFRELMGQTPSQYVTQKRIAWASQRLLFSEDAIETIARDGGWSDRFSFSRAFSRQMGTSPVAYRRAPRV